MIPKKIHYCWFGGNPLPEAAKKCIASWKKYCPDYDIKEWNESNFDVNCCDYVKEAYEAKKWAFVSDVARLYVLINYGGIYMDTDMEVIKSLDSLLNYEALTGFESDENCAAGLLMCSKNNALFTEFYQQYLTIHFKNNFGEYDYTTIVKRLTDMCLKYGLKQNNSLQVVNGMTILPKEYFYAKDYVTGKVNITKNTYTIHHYDSSWLTGEKKYIMDVVKKIGSEPYKYHFASFIAAIKYRGMTAAIKDVFKWVQRQKDNL